MDRRSLLKAGLALSALPLGASVQPVRAQAKQIRVYWSTGQLGRSLKVAFVDTFADKASIEVQEGGDNPRFTQMQASRAMPTFDVGTFTDVIMPLVLRSGLIAELDQRAIPNLATVEAGLRPWGAHAIPYAYGSWGIVYNAAKVTRPPNAWSDLLGEPLRGRVTAPNITYNSSIYTLDALARSSGGKLSDPDDGLKAMRQLRLSGPGLWDQESIAVGWLKTGEVWATPMYSGNALALMDDPDVRDLRFVVPSEGGYVVPNNLVKLSRAPNPGGADLFINHILSKAAQAGWASIGRSRPARSDVPVPADVAAATPVASDMRRVDFEWLAANRSSLLARWNAIVNG